MTFSLAARCPDTGMFGLGVASSSVAVGNRCPWARAGVGAILTQNRTDIRLGPHGLDLLARGQSAAHTVNILVAQSEYADFRQIAALDAQGLTAFYSGPKIETINSGWQGRACVSIGNALASPDVPRAMVAAFEASAGKPFAERLLVALDSGLAAGGEIDPILAAALLIVDKMPWPLVDLRIDYQENALGALRRLWAVYERYVEFFVAQVMRPHELDAWPW